MIPKLLAILGLLLFYQASFAQSKPPAFLKKTHYEVVDFEDLMHRYFGKDAGSISRLEGIYSVSCVITKSSRGWLTGQLKVKVVERKDNYARVAILKDWPGSQRDFIEVSLSYHVSNVYPIVGELSTLSSGGEAYIYKHIEPDGSARDFSMAPALPDMIEGEYSQMHKRKTISYKLSYMKIYPKENSQELVRGTK
jgi:hypothetical protein